MSSILDTIKDVFVNDSFSSNKDPLHVGEVMNLWTYYTLLDEANRYVEVALNTTRDSDLLELLKSSFDQCHKQTIELEEFLRTEGITIPPTSESKPKSDLNDIPLGVKLTDSEIANGIAVKDITAITMCSAGITQAVRTDVGTMWLKYLLTKTKSSAKLKILMKKRGWLKIPPYYTPSGMPKK